MAIDIINDKIYTPSAYIAGKELIWTHSFNLAVQTSSSHSLITIHSDMPPAITLPGSFFSSSPPPPSAAADVIRVKQARKPSSPPPPAPARQINTTQHIDVPSQPSAIFPAPARNVNAIKSSDARFISILADGHVFDIPADLVKRYCWVRERTIKSYRAVTAGTASPGDLAFIFGTLSLSHVDRAPDLGIGSEKAAQPIQKTSNEGGKVEQSRNETALEEHQREDPGARVFQEDGTQGLPYSKRAIEVIEISDEEEEDPIQHPRRRIRHLPAENGALQDDMHIVPRSGTQLIPQIPALARWDRRQWPVPIFAGDFASVHDAEMSTGMRRTWVMGKYVEGEISFEGQFAQVRFMSKRCSRCSQKGNGKACRVLVGGGDTYVVSAKCGWCLKGGFIVMRRKGIRRAVMAGGQWLGGKRVG